MKVLFLGSGTSSGVPLLACSCEVCTSSDTKDKRLRSAVLVQADEKNILIDIGPDFRQQLLRENIKQLNGVLVTHGHKDHTGGLDDIRAYNFAQKESMHLYCDKLTKKMIVAQNDYMFTENPYPGVASVDIHEIDKTAFKIGDIKIEPLDILHGKMPIKGFKINGFVYLTDIKFMEEHERKKIRGCNTLVVNAIRHKPHHAHFNLEEALEFIDDIKPKRSYLTHISHWLGKHSHIQPTLPPNVNLAYDGLRIEV